MSMCHLLYFKLQGYHLIFYKQGHQLVDHERYHLIFYNLQRPTFCSYPILQWVSNVCGEMVAFEYILGCGGMFMTVRNPCPILSFIFIPLDHVLTLRFNPNICYSMSFIFGWQISGIEYIMIHFETMILMVVYQPNIQTFQFTKYDPISKINSLEITIQFKSDVWCYGINVL